MLGIRKKNSDEELPFLVARSVPETKSALRARRIRAIVTAAAGFLIISYVNNRLAGVARENQANPTYGLLLVAGALAFFLGMGRYILLRRTERILRRNPWMEWTGSARNVRIGPLAVAHLLTLRHPDWPNDVVRLGAGSAPIDGEGDYWVAGNPARKVVVSPGGGAQPRLVHRALPEKILRGKAAQGESAPGVSET